MKRLSTSILIVVLAFFSTAVGAKKKPPCKPNLAKCPLVGCGGGDPELNKRKNIRTNNQEPTLRTLKFMKELENPDKKEFKKKHDRALLTPLGEGQMITVVGYMLVARPSSAESCNCRLIKPSETDNHLVLVEEETLAITRRATKAKPSTATKKAVKARTARQNTLDAREKQSITAEFTPRVKLDHPNFKRENLTKRIDKAPKNALLVRVTGLLMFDSEHFLGKALHRVNNWEIHPVFKFEFCETGNDCTADSDDGWKSLDDLP
jgi:hypothetical protein